MTIYILQQALNLTQKGVTEKGVTEKGVTQKGVKSNGCCCVWRELVPFLSGPRKGMKLWRIKKHTHKKTQPYVFTVPDTHSAYM